MSDPRQRDRSRVGVGRAEIEVEQYSAQDDDLLEGEMDQYGGGEDSALASDFSSRGIYHDENFARDAYGVGDAFTAGGRAERLGPREFEVYGETAESEFSIRTADGLERGTEVEARYRDEPNPASLTGRERQRAEVRRSDQQLQEIVSDRLAAAGSVDASKVRVTVADGEVWLAGDVPDRVTRRRAEDIAGRVAGVRDVLNNLRIRRAG